MPRHSEQVSFTAEEDAGTQHGRVARRPGVAPPMTSVVSHGHARMPVAAPVAAPPTSQAASASRIPYGTARYDGLAYLILPGARADLDLRQLHDAATDRNGLSRYGCAGLPTLYLALDTSSAIAEACYHFLNDCRRDAEPFDCALYQLRVRGRFADLHGRERHHPELLADDYRLTQELARRVRATRLHGVLYPSARSNGFCLAAFAEHVLCASRFAGFVAVRVQSERAVRVRAAGGAHWRLLQREELRRFARPRS
jgi:hypothetical protein